MRSALLSVAIWSLQLCCGSIAAAKSTHTFSCETPGDTVYIADITGMLGHIAMFQPILLCTAVLAALELELQLLRPAEYTLLQYLT